MIHDGSPLKFNDAQPSRVDVVVIGGGIAGICTAWFLLEKNLSVLVCEKGRIAAEQSSRNWGWVRQQGRDPAELPIMMDSMTLWEDFSRLLGNELGFTRQGVLYLADSDREMAGFEAWRKIANEHGLDTRLISSQQVDTMLGPGSGHYRGALHTPGDGRAEPLKAVPAIAAELHKRGCRIMENCAVRTVETRNGAVSVVHTELGPTETAAVVCAAGAWSSTFLRNLGITFPQLTVRCTVARTAQAPLLYNGNAATSDIAFRRRQDGGYSLALTDFQEHIISADSFRYFRKFLPTLRASWKDTRLRIPDDFIGALRGYPAWSADTISPFEQIRVLNPAPSDWAIDQIRKRKSKRLPALSGVDLEESWAGMIDMTPDIVPVLDEVYRHAGLYLASGFSGHGFGIGPAAGKVMAALVAGDSVNHDLSRFRFLRFHDGSPIQLGPMI